MSDTSTPYAYERQPGSAGVQRGVQSRYDNLLDALDDLRAQSAKTVDALAAHRERREARRQTRADARAEARQKREQGLA